MPLHMFLKLGIAEIIKIIVLTAEWPLNRVDPNVAFYLPSLTSRKSLI